MSASPGTEFAAHEWVSQTGAVVRLGVSLRTLARLVAEGRIAKRHLPHARPRYRLADIERLLDEHTTPAAARD